MNRGLRTLALACALMAALIAGANADNHTWITVPSGNWNVATNWDVGAVPVAGDRADVGPQHSGCTAVVSDAQSMQDLYVGLSSAGTVDIQATGDLEISRFCVIGYSYLGSAGIGTVLLAGKLAAPTIYLAFGTQIGVEESRIVQSSGAVTSSTAFYMGAADGTRAYVDQNGGTNYFQLLALGRNYGSYSVYTITNGTLTAFILAVGEAGAACTGRLTVSGSAKVTVTNSLVLGNGGAGQDGSLNMNGGTLDTPVLRIGNSSASGSYCVTQTGGTVTCPSIIMAWTAGPTSRYVMTAGVLNGSSMHVGYNGGAATAASIELSGGMMNLDTLILGWSGAGTRCFVNQSGGTNRVTGDLEIGVNPGGSNAYTVSGGLLDAGNIYVGGHWGSANTGTLAYAGGEIHASGLTVKGAPSVAKFRLVLPQAGLSPIAVTNGVTLNGTLEIERAGSYKFSPNTVITAMTYSAISGRTGFFAQTNLLGGMECRVNYDVPVDGSRYAITLDQLRPALVKGTIIAVR